jgi:soluble cytochrome b562
MEDINKPEDLAETFVKALRKAVDANELPEDGYIEIRKILKKGEIALNQKDMDTVDEMFRKGFDVLNKKIDELKRLKKEQRAVYKNPRALAELQQSLFTNTGYNAGDFAGKTESGDYIFKTKHEQKAFYPSDKLLTNLSAISRRAREGQGLLIPPPPDATARQLKNLWTLTIMLCRENEKRQREGQEPTNILEASWNTYIKTRKGYTDEEIGRGGKISDILKYTTISGGITTFVSEDDRYFKIRHHHFYDLDIPKNPKEKWKWYFNEPYAQVMIAQGGQYTPIYLKAIQDTQTDQKKGYLLFFLTFVIPAYQNNPKTGFRSQLKVKTLLDKIKASDFTKDRPQEAFKILSECISYVFNNYAGVLSEIRFLNKKYKPVVIKDLSIFSKTGYKEFVRQYLKPLGIADIREVLISFNPISDSPEPKQLEAGYQKGEIIADV